MANNDNNNSNNDSNDSSSNSSNSSCNSLFLHDNNNIFFIFFLSTNGLTAAIISPVLSAEACFEERERERIISFLSLNINIFDIL